MNKQEYANFCRGLARMRVQSCFNVESMDWWNKLSVEDRIKIHHLVLSPSGLLINSGDGPKFDQKIYRKDHSYDRGVPLLEEFKEADTKFGNDLFGESGMFKQ